MVTISGHLEGKLIVLDEPLPEQFLQMHPNRPLILNIQQPDLSIPILPETPIAAASALHWIVANAVDDDFLPTDLALNYDAYLRGALLKDSDKD